MDWFDKAVALTWLALTYQQNRILARGNPPLENVPSFRQRIIGPLSHYWPTLIVVFVGAAYFFRPLVFPPQLTVYPSPPMSPSPQISVAASPVPSATPAKSEPNPFDQNISNLLLDFLRLPRPCVLRVSAPPERLNERRLLAGLARNAAVRLLGRGTFLIPACQVTNDDEDANPQLYKQQQYPDSGMAIHASDTQKETRDFLGTMFRSQFGMRVTDDSILPDGSPAGLIYIQLGHKLFE